MYWYIVFVYERAAKMVLVLNEKKYHSYEEAYDDARYWNQVQGSASAILCGEQGTSLESNYNNMKQTIMKNVEVQLAELGGWG